MQIKLGWTEAAMIAGAREVGLSPSIVGSFPRKEAALVEVFHSLYELLHNKMGPLEAPKKQTKCKAYTREISINSRCLVSTLCF